MKVDSLWLPKFTFIYDIIKVLSFFFKAHYTLDNQKCINILKFDKLIYISALFDNFPVMSLINMLLSGEDFLNVLRDESVQRKVAAL